MEYESAEVTRSREERRASLSARTSELLETLAKKPVGDLENWYRANRGRFFFDPEDISSRIGMINELYPDRKDRLIATAERLLRHEFDILGSGLVSLGPRIDWQLDFKSGIRWRNDVIYPAWNWRKVDGLDSADIYQGHFYSIDDPSDLKVPWDLSSFFHLPPLAEAYRRTGDPRYSKEAVDQVRAWHEENPYPRGVNWTCAMAVGIRLANMVFGLRLIEPADFMGETGVISILRHIKFILDFLEVDQDGRRNNHYVNDLVGLGFGAVEIAHSDLGRSLLDFVFDELKRELTVQFSEDGTNFEGTIPYHRFAAESVILTLMLLERNGRPVPAESRAQIERILRFIDFYSKPNGLAPQFGDNDNGRILVLHDYDAQEYRDHRHILAVGGAWLGIDGLAGDLSGQGADAVWLTGREAPSRRESPPFLAGLYSANGYALARSGESSFLMRCGRINPMSGGGHNHCDQLSLEFHDRGQDLIVDPGATVYSADSALRNYYRSTAAHNVVQLDHLEQQDFNPRDLFSMQDRAAAVLDSWEVVDAMAHFRGRHSAYAAAGWIVCRECHCSLCEGSLSVCDTLEGTAGAGDGQEFCGRLHLAADIKVEQSSPSIFLLTGSNLRWTIRFSGGLRVGQVPGSVSPGYGVSLPAVILEYRFTPAQALSASFFLERIVS